MAQGNLELWSWEGLGAGVKGPWDEPPCPVCCQHYHTNAEHSLSIPEGPKL